MTEKDRITLKARFEIRRSRWKMKDGRESEDISLILPGECFETYCKPEMYSQYDDPEDAMRENAVQQFEYELRMLESKYSKLGFGEIEHWYDKNGEPRYQVDFPDLISEHYSDIVWDPEKDPEPPAVPMRYERITASDLEELDIRLEIALEEQLGHFPEPEMPEWELFRLSFRKLVEERPELGESDEFWWLLRLLVFGIFEEREFARKRLNEMIALTRNDPYNTNYMAVSARDAKKAMYRKMSESEKLDVMKTFEECRKQGLDLFESYLKSALENKTIHSPSGLAKTVGVDPGYFGNVRGGKRKISKAAALRLGIGLHLMPEDMTRFMASLDHCFPITENDHKLCDELRRRNYELDELVNYFPRERTDENKVR